MISKTGTRAENDSRMKTPVESAVVMCSAVAIPTIENVVGRSVSSVLKETSID